jgi:hypothetical protein
MGLFVAEFARIPMGGQREIVGILANSATAIRNAQFQRRETVLEMQRRSR